MSDPRFARLRTDPRFRKPKKSKTKVVVDERFKSIFDGDEKGKKNKSAARRVDKYGRKVSDAQEKDNLKRLYHLDDEKDPESGPSKLDYARGEVLLESSSEEEDDDADASEESGDDDVHLHRHTPKLKALQDLEELEVDLNEDDETLAELDAQVAAYNRDNPEEEGDGRDGSATHRIAVVNLDWDHVRASHLYKICSSLARVAHAEFNLKVAGRSSSTSTNAIRGKVINVRVYPSEFGKTRMKREEVEGPPKELFQSEKSNANGGTVIEEDDGKGYNEEALRKYQLERLRYYYAIISCDTPETAAYIVSELDGTELERSANVFDLSFVPDEMTFDDEFRDEATSSADIDGPSFKGLDFSTDALRHSKVRLRWDEDDAERDKVTRRALTRQEIDEGNFNALIASSSESESDTGSHPMKGDRDKLRKLLLNNDDDQLPEGWGEHDEDETGEGNIEITFRPALSGGVENEEETTLEKYKRKQKEKRKKKKEGVDIKPKETGDGEVEKDDFFGDDSDAGEDKTERREATRAELELVAAPDDNTVQHFDMNAIIKEEKRKGKKGKKGHRKASQADQDDTQDDFQLDVTDSRFKAIHEDPNFAIDPSNPHYKKTKGMSAILEERTKRQKVRHETDNTASETKFAMRESNPTASLQKLVESVKRKSSQKDGKGSGKRKRS
ncbi:hypothetical protein SCHPADRAFT_913851 [Schizopora paradoxa]|uniref:Uncharacterized protein n=1 Tax=Schizopora paradoxa TaxID=27342 RepID=A0A0H2SJ04_9AGAM|nr:hypothetical protein SCHPADRAFT_913851 [Schizopora paradoxa]